jgi:DNA helicase II / ATP-dependent DNA helicase PcrA
MKYSEEQMQILEDDSRFVQVIAAAGSGKTSTMVGLLSKILEDKKEPSNKILVLTFTRKATREFKERLERMHPDSGVKIHTFHAYCLSVLQRYHPEFKKNPAKVLDETQKNQIWKDILRNYKFQIGGIPFEFLMNPKNTELEEYFPGLLSEMNEVYQGIKKENKYLDFDDLVQMYLEGLREKAAWAKEAKQELSRIIIDEFQDTDLTQLEWVQLMDPEKLTVVGDDWQAIYGFRGATVEPFLEFSKSFPGTSLRYLSTNYRSLPKVVEYSGIPIQYNKRNISKKVKAHRMGLGRQEIILLEDERDWLRILTIVSQDPSKSKVLCRTNFRILKLEQVGFPKDALLTIHASKGLEFETVFLDLTEGWSNEDLEDLEEERRILYVGLSRAKDNLFIVAKQTYRKNRLEKVFLDYFLKRMKSKSVEALF